MPDDTLKKYCVTIRTKDVNIMVIMDMDETHYKLVTGSQNINWLFNNGCQIMIDKNSLDEFSVELMQ